MREDPELDVLQQRGMAHEQRYLADLESAGRRVTRIERSRVVLVGRDTSWVLEVREPWR